MDKLINSAFDFFAYALPGSCILASFFILDATKHTGEQYLELADKMQIGSGIVLLVLGYAVGFAITPLGRLLYRKIYKSAFFKLLDKLLDGNLAVYEANETKIFVSNKFALVRELSPNNFKYIESWNVYSLMSHNMAVAGLLAVALIITKLVWCHPTNPEFWWKVAIIVLLLVILFIYSSVKFNIWSVNDQNAAIVALNLRERAQKLAEQESTNEPARES